MWNRNHEAMPREKLARLQFLRLKQTLEAVYQLVPHYQKIFREIGAEPGDIRSLADPVSYTHLDVYKRQVTTRAIIKELPMGLSLIHI